MSADEVTGDELFEADAPLEEELLETAPGEAVGQELTLASEARTDDALALIDACRREDQLKAPYKEHLRNTPALFELLGLPPGKRLSGERTKLLEALVDDAAAVVAAYAVASDLAARKPPTTAAVRKALTAVLDGMAQIRAAEKKIAASLSSVAGQHALALLEEAALVGAFKKATGCRPRYRFRPFGPTSTLPDDPARAAFAALSRGIRMRRGIGMVRSAVRQPSDLSVVLSAARDQGLSGEAAEKAAAIAERIPAALFGNATGSELMDAAKAALSAFQSHAKDQAPVVPAANLVLVLGAMELLCAWCPTRPPTTSATGRLARVVEELHGARFATEEEWQPREWVLKVPVIWRLGHAATLFDGVDPDRSVRRRCQLNYQLSAEHGRGSSEGFVQIGRGRMVPARG